MTPKSIVYMVVAVFIGYVLVSAVPGQVAMYTSPPLPGEKGDTVTLTGSGFSPENESRSVEENGTVELFWDTVTSNESHGLWVDNESISLDIVEANGTPAGSVITISGHGFSPGNESISGEVENLSEFVVGSDNISSVAESAADAVAAAEAAADAVSSVASKAGEASEAAADAAEAASALKSASSGLEFMGTLVWLTVDVLVALVVYWFAKRRFA